VPVFNFVEQVAFVVSNGVTLGEHWESNVKMQPGKMFKGLLLNVTLNGDLANGTFVPVIVVLILKNES